MEELINKAKKGDIIAYTELIKFLEKDLYRIARTRLNNEDDICDAIQNTMLKIFRHIKKLKEPAFFKTWTIKILINECNMIYKQNSRQNKILEKSILVSEIDKNNIDYDNFMRFENIINNLKSDEQLIFSLYYKDKYSCKEISKITNIKESTVKSKLVRGREKIKKILEEDF